MPDGTPNLPLSYIEAHGDRPALIDGELTITHAELAKRARLAGGRLREQGVKTGEVVGVQLPNVWEYPALELAIPLIGAIVMPLPLNLGRTEIEHALKATGARRILRQPEAEALTAQGAPKPLPPPDPDPERIVEVALTSGSTGLPKLASLHAGLKQATFERFTARLGVTVADRVLVMSPLMQGIGGMCLFCLRAGAALVMLRRPRFDAAHTLRVASGTKATLLVGVPTNLIRMLEAPEVARPDLDLAAARCTAVAGAPLPPEVARAWETRTGSRVVSFYGTMDAGQLAVGSPSDPVEKRWYTVGRPHDGVDCMITPEGEICMRGPTVQKRFWGEAQGPFSADGWAHLGDLGFIDEEGFLHVSGRLKDIIIRGGTNINPHEVEDHLRTHPGVRDACVVGRPDHDLGERAVAFVVGSLSLPELREHLEARGLARYKWPESVEIIEELPLKGPGKVDRTRLKELASAESPLR
ncbi:MAG TPA: class I adenylate-forming enzyme family protein [Candidatus Dormibacteraeota bacterium]